MDEVKQFQPWFGMEQEYTLFGLDGKQLGWSPEGNQLQRGALRIDLFNLEPVILLKYNP